MPVTIILSWHYLGGRLCETISIIHIVVLQSEQHKMASAKGSRRHVSFDGVRSVTHKQQERAREFDIALVVRLTLSRQTETTSGTWPYE